jgi:hypothetical protein
MDKVGSTASLDPSRSTRPTNQRRVQPRVVIVATPRECRDWALSNTTAHPLHTNCTPTARLYIQDTHNWTEATWLYANVPQAMNELLPYPSAVRFGSLQDLSDLFQGWGHGIIGVVRAAGIVFPVAQRHHDCQNRICGTRYWHALAGCTKNWNVLWLIQKTILSRCRSWAR